MAGYLGSKAVLLSTTAATVTGNATIAGDLTVDTDTLYVDSTNNRIGIGIDDPSAKLHLQVSGDDSNLAEVSRFETTNSGETSLRVLVGQSNVDATLRRVAIDAYRGDSNVTPIAFTQTTSAGTTEAMRLDASGNLLVGKTALSTSTVGCELRANGKLVGTIDGGNHYFNRLTSFGEIVKFAKDNTTKGTIRIPATDNFAFIGESGNATIGAGDTGLIISSAESIRPFNPSTNASRDNAIGLGESWARFTDLYATDGSINTSDGNEKQDKELLTATEMLVAKRISALFKTFKWKDAVAKKGADARTHIGVIAQDVQAAFTAEGLDSGDYGLFISSTWYVDSEGNKVEEGTEGAISKTRMGIRYNELMSFVAAYNEQRFASIEARLTALEAV